MEEKKTTPVFVIDPAPVPWPVDVRVPAPGGEFVIQRFTALMNVLSEDEYSALLNPPVPAAVDVGLSGTNTTVSAVPPEKTEAEHLADNARLFPSFVAGWEGVARADGSPVPFSVEALAAIVTGPLGKAVSAALWKAVSEVRHGVRLGNFEAPPAAG